MLFVAWNPAVVKALIPDRHDTALPLCTLYSSSGDTQICFSLPGCLVVIFAINFLFFFYEVLLNRIPQLVEAGDQIMLCFR